jgi:hypothetical protein
VNHRESFHSRILDGDTNVLIQMSRANPSIKKGLSSAKLFRSAQVSEHPENWDFSWIPKDSPFWCKDELDISSDRIRHTVAQVIIALVLVT